jgi:hypothetical protein
VEHLKVHARSVNIQVQRIYENRMSYRGKQSLLAAIGARFVIFCSTMSNALPLEAIKEEVKACKAISNDPQRLKCFDGIFMDTPSQPNAAEKERMKRTGKSRRANRQRMVVR